MKILFTIEFKNNEGEDDYFEVELEAHPRWDNDSFDYAGTHCTHGIAGTCKLPDYATLANNPDVTWDKSEHTDCENKLIEDFIKNDFDDIDDTFCRKLEKEAEEYCY